MTETESGWSHIISGIVIIFAIIGAFSTLFVVQNLNQQYLLSSESSITANITVSDITLSSNGGYPMGFIDRNDGKGYLTGGIFSFSRMDRPIVGHIYRIKYFCNPFDNNNRDVMEMIDLAANPYTCITINGVCK